MSQVYKALFRECYFLIDLLITMYYVTVCYNNCVFFLAALSVLLWRKCVCHLWINGLFPYLLILYLLTLYWSDPSISVTAFWRLTEKLARPRPETRTEAVDRNTTNQNVAKITFISTLRVTVAAYRQWPCKAKAKTAIVNEGLEHNRIKQTGQPIQSSHSFIMLCKRRFKATVTRRRRSKTDASWENGWTRRD